MSLGPRPCGLRAPTEQFYELEPGQTLVRDAMQVVYDGPALLDEARVPIHGYYV